MSEERRVAPRSAHEGPASVPSFPPVAPQTPHTPIAPVAPIAKGPDPSAGSYSLVRDAVRDGAREARDSRDLTPAPGTSPREGGQARRRHSVRIPDDEIQRPSVDAAEKATQRRPSPLPDKPPEVQLGVLTPMRIITINAEPTPAPPPMALQVVTPVLSVPAAPPAAPASAPAVPPDPPTVPSLALLDTETPLVPEAAPLSESQVETPRALAPLDADEVEVRFEEEAPAPAAGNPPADPIAHESEPEPETRREAAMAAPPDASPAPRDRRSEPPAEVAAEDVFSIEAHDAVDAPAPTAPAAPPEPPRVGSLPPMRARAPSQPPLPRPKKPAAPAPEPSARPALVFVPPHVGSIPPQGPDSAGARRKPRYWWEELFNDDFIRTSEKVSDAFIKREVRFIEESLGVEKGGALLDLGCGTGRHANELARQGYEVVGFDLSLPMLARAGDEAQEHSTKINFMQGDMREMTFEEQFDGVFCWNTSFGYFEEDKNAQVVDKVHRALKGGGLFLLDVINRDFLVRQSPSLAWFEGDGCVCMDEMSIDFITSRMKVKRTMMLDDGRSREIEYTIRVYTLSELGKILHEHGFKVREVSGGLAAPGVFFGNESPRVIVLAEKR